MENGISIFWFRRDLRLEDNSGLYHALKSGKKIIPIFIFDKQILDDLITEKGILEFDKRVIFIYDAILNLKETLKRQDVNLQVYYGNPIEIWSEIVLKWNISSVFTNHDYEPYAEERDKEISQLFKNNNIEFLTFKDQCIFEKGEILKPDNKPYTIFTPYSRKWKEKLNSFYYKSYPCEIYFSNFSKQTYMVEMPKMEEMGFAYSNIEFPAKNVSNDLIENYLDTRNFPYLTGTSKISIHLRFGTISIRKLVAQAILSKDSTFLNELIWRDFYMMILFHFPSVVSNAFKPDYDKIKWRNNNDEFLKWCNGITGYPIVDAGMRELNATGFMHNRVRMIVASFLTKHLLIDWRWGEAYFAKKLLDFELSSNNGGWQWAASSGCDAVPYFRIFNPKLQTEKFDPQLKYIRKWIPELDTFDYPIPMVDHEFARKRCLETFKLGLNRL
jgi:deoxyribodipyrimidine photo-lyase